MISLRKHLFKRSVAYCFILGVLLLISNIANAKDPLFDQESLLKNFDESFLSNLDASPEQEKHFPAKLMVKLNMHSGKVFDLEFRNPSNDPQTSLDLLDAVVSIGVLPIPYAYRGEGPPLQFEINFGKPYNKKSMVNARFKHKAKAAKGYCTFHSIPLSVLRRYPGRFNYEELCKSSHIRQLETKEVSSDTVEKLREPWLNFFEAHPNASKVQILKFEKKVDRQFGTIWLSTKTNDDLLNRVWSS